MKTGATTVHQCDYPDFLLPVSLILSNPPNKVGRHRFSAKGTEMHFQPYEISECMLVLGGWLESYACGEYA